MRSAMFIGCRVRSGRHCRRSTCRDAAKGYLVAGNSAELARSVMSKINPILVTVTQGSTHSMSEIARTSGLPMSTAHRLTSELAFSRLLEALMREHLRSVITGLREV